MINNDTKIKKMLRNVGDTYKEIGSYLKDNKWFILLILLIIIEIIVFYVINEPANDHYVDYVNETEGKYSGLFQFIFFENLKTITKTLLFGVIPVFMGSLFAAMLTIMGLVASFKLILSVVPVEIVLLGTVPHGIIEIPCIVLSLVLGCLVSKEITLAILKIVRKKDLVVMGKIRKTIGIKRTFLFMIKSWLFIVLPMTLTAALIETYITPIIMGAAGV